MIWLKWLSRMGLKRVKKASGDGDTVMGSAYLSLGPVQANPCGCGGGWAAPGGAGEVEERRPRRGGTSTCPASRREESRRGRRVQGWAGGQRPQLRWLRTSSIATSTTSVSARLPPLAFGWDSIQLASWHGPPKLPANAHAAAAFMRVHGLSAHSMWGKQRWRI
jgi:hypothetical protein